MLDHLRLRNERDLHTLLLDALVLQYNGTPYTYSHAKRRRRVASRERDGENAVFVDCTCFVLKRSERRLAEEHKLIAPRTNSLGSKKNKTVQRT